MDPTNPERPRRGAPAPGTPLSHPRGKRAIGGALVVVALCAATCSAASAQGAGASQSRKAPTVPGAPEAFAAWAKREMTAQGIPGMSVAVVENYKLSWAAGFGMSNLAKGTKVTPATLFQAASVSEAISAIAMMIAFERKGIPIDSSYERVLESMPLHPASEAWRLQNPYPTPVTLRMLLSHIGGTNDFRYPGYRLGEPIPTMYQELAGLPPANTPKTEVVRAPGMTWVSSPAGFTMLQALIEDLYGRPFAAVMHDLLLGPLGLTDSSFAQPEPANLVARTAVPYVTDGTPLPDGPRVFNSEASSGLVTSATSLAKIFISFQRALASSPSTGDPIPPELAKAMIVRQPGVTADGQCLPTTEANLAACKSPQGLGFDTNLNQYFQHLPDNQPTGSWFGQRGFNSGYLTYALGSKTGGNAVVVMINVAPEDMSGPAPQASFITEALERVADGAQFAP
jgi:CubicO group peptidase (beta-lactamase class C family)